MTTVTATPTTATPTANPHRTPTLITGWAVIAVVIGGLYGAGNDPEHAEWSALAIVTMIGCYVFNKARAVAHDRRTRKAAR